MKGIILAGGLGSRLKPLTKVTNKHLLPVYNKPMIFYPIETLIEAGIDDIMIVTGGNHAGAFLQLLGNGKDFGLKDISYTYQEGEGGIAEALGLCEHFSEGDDVVVMLGDNIIENSIKPYIDNFYEQKTGARILLKEVPDPNRFGVPTINGENITKITEKPDNPDSNYAVTGIYIYDHQVFEFIKNLKPSDRGELEITDVNNMYISQNNLKFDVMNGFWTDAGTIESLYLSSELVKKKFLSK